MKRYSFRLQSVLKSRKVVEERERAVMLNAAAVLEASNERLESIRTSMDDAVSGTGGGLVVARDLQFQRDQFDRYGKELTAARAAVVERSGEYDLARFSWTEAKSKVAMLERLDETQRDLWRTETLKADQDLTDEVAMVHSKTGAFA